MRFKPYLLTILTTAFVVQLGFIIPIARAFCVGGGGLAITEVPAGLQSFGNTLVSYGTQELVLTFSSPVRFEDMRGSTAGFSLSVSATDFVDAATSYRIDVTSLDIASDDNDVLGYENCDDATGIALDALDFSAFTDADDNGVSDAKILYTGDTQARVGQYLFETQLRLRVPPYTPIADAYAATVTFTIF